MKTLNKIVLSLLLAVGISNVNLNSMINRDGLLDNDAGLIISQELVEKAGFKVTKAGRVLFQNNRSVSTPIIVDAVLEFIGYNKAAINFDELEAGQYSDNETWMDSTISFVKNEVVGRYYDLEDSLEALMIKAANLRELVSKRGIEITTEVTVGGLILIHLGGWLFSDFSVPRYKLIAECAALAGITSYEIKTFLRK